MYRESLDLKISDVCTGCGICVKECVNGVLRMNPATGKPEVAEGGEDRCIHCQHCLCVCPCSAFSMDEVDPAKCEAPLRNMRADFASLSALVKTRYSCRHYLQENVADETIRRLLDSMRHVPTGVNAQDLFFSVMEDMDVLRKFRNKLELHLLKLYDMAEPDSETRRILHGFPEAIQAGKDLIFRTAPHLILASYRENAPCGMVDSVIALSYFELLANSLGLGTVWCGRIIVLLNRLAPEFYQEFKLPPGYRPGFAMLFGYPQNHLYRVPQRSVPGISHIC